MMENKIKEVTWYTFEDIVTVIEDGVKKAPYFTLSGLSVIISEIGKIDKSRLVYCDFNDPNTDALWDDLYANHYDDFVISLDSSETLTKDSARLWFYKFLRILNKTSPYYLAVLNAYKSKESDLLAKIGSTYTGTTQFNDTPETTGEDYTGNSYMTNWTKNQSTSENDGMTPMQRLAEIQNHYKRTMSDWLEEFDVIFIHPENIHGLED